MEDEMLHSHPYNTPAFLSGSRVYGEPKEDSDTDLCIYMPDCVSLSHQEMITKIADSADGIIEYGSGRLSLRFGKLNLIIHSDLPSYRAWQEVTRELERSKLQDKTITREEAGKMLDERERAFIDQIA